MQGNHLGSTSLVLDTSGLEVAKRSYLPFGDSLSGQNKLGGIKPLRRSAKGQEAFVPHQAYARVRENPAHGASA